MTFRCRSGCKNCNSARCEGKQNEAAAESTRVHPCLRVILGHLADLLLAMRSKPLFRMPLALHLRLLSASMCSLHISNTTPEPNMHFVFGSEMKIHQSIIQCYGPTLHPSKGSEVDPLVDKTVRSQNVKVNGTRKLGWKMPAADCAAVRDSRSHAAAPQASAGARAGKDTQADCVKTRVH
ncbi:hypothetical protein M3J09_006953 [Ascochyta lentis]